VVKVNLSICPSARMLRGDARALKQRPSPATQSGELSYQSQINAQGMAVFALLLFPTGRQERPVETRFGKLCRRLICSHILATKRVRKGRLLDPTQLIYRNSFTAIRLPSHRTENRHSTRHSIMRASRIPFMHYCILSYDRLLSFRFRFLFPTLSWILPYYFIVSFICRRKSPNPRSRCNEPQSLPPFHS
jgi:hypothetical protein